MKPLYFLTFFVILSAQLALAQGRADQGLTRQQRKLNIAVKTLCKYRGAIIEAAHEQQVNSRNMFACLLSEHTFLKNNTDDLVDAAARLGIHKDPSLGLTQIKLSTARSIAKEIYGEAQSDEKIISDLLRPRLATHYMAILIGSIIDDYARFGFDIQDSPGVICSSYLVGNSYVRARTHYENGTSPGLNYYGRFAQKNLPLANSLQQGLACNP